MQQRSPFSLILALTAALAAAVCAYAAQAANIAHTFALPPDFYPESIAAGPHGTFYIGSWHHGSIARLRPGETTARVFVPSGSNGLTNTQGVLVDSKRGLLWACSSDIGYSTAPHHPSALKAFDLKTGAPRGSYKLPGSGLCNDLALAHDGRIFVTDSLHPRILVLDGVHDELKPWLVAPQFCPKSGPYCLNGIAIEPGHAIYVGLVTAAPKLFRIPLRADGSPGKVETIRFPRTLKNADGIRYLDHNRLLIFETNAFAKNDPLDGRVSLATVHANGSATLDTLVNGLASPSSGLAYGRRVYFIQTKYAILFKHEPGDSAVIPHGVPFTVQSAPLPAQAGTH
jgi:sugar lactone lactonase YvrE